MRELILAVAAPGGGKDWTYDNYFKSSHIKVSADDYFMKDGVYNFNPTLLSLAHGECKRKCVEAMLLGDSVYVSNTNTRHKERNCYINLAHEHSYNLRVLVLNKNNNFTNIHGVPEDKVNEMRSRIDLDEGVFTYSNHLGYLRLLSLNDFLGQRKAWQ